MSGIMQKIKMFFKKDPNASSSEPEDPSPGGAAHSSSQDPLVHDLVLKLKKLNETTVKEIMVPRVDMYVLKSTDNFENVLTKIYQSGYSRIPVYEDSIDNIIGILYVKDLLKLFQDPQFLSSNGTHPPEIHLKEIIRPAYFIPEGQKLTILLKEFQEKRLHMAIIVDEYGGISGLVTLEDVIEEIVGDIQDEYDNEKEMIVPVSANKTLVNARCPIDELNESIHTDLPTDKSETIGGFVYHLFGEVPGDGEKILYNRYEFKVNGLVGNKIQRILITKLPPEIPVPPTTHSPEKENPNPQVQENKNNDSSLKEPFSSP